MNQNVFQRLNHPIVCLLIVLTFVSIFTFGRLSQSEYDPSSFILAGDAYCNPNEVPQNLKVLKNSEGYDGQFYYRFALRPFTAQQTEFGIKIDNPPYRQQRFLYPFLVHLISLGNPSLVPIVMIGINFVFLCIMALIAGKLAQTLNQHALWGLLIVFYPGFLFTYSRDLVETVEITFLLGSILLIHQSKAIGATILLTLAVLTKETSLIVAAAAATVYVVNWMRGEKEKKFGWYYFVIPIIAFCSIQFALFFNWGQFPARSGAEAVFGNLPLVAFASFLIKMSAMQDAFQRSQFVALIFLIIFTLGVLYHLLITKTSFHEILCCFVYGALIASVGFAVWAEDVAFFRAFTHFYVFGAIVILASKVNFVKSFLAGCTFAIWLFEFMRLGFPGIFAQFTASYF